MMELELWFLETPGNNTIHHFYCVTKKNFTLIIDLKMFQNVIYDTKEGAIFNTINDYFPMLKNDTEFDRIHVAKWGVSYEYIDQSRNKEEKLSFLKKIYEFTKIHKINPVTIDPHGSELIYFVLKSDEDNSIAILVFQEDSNGNLRQLNSTPDLNLNYRAIFNSTFNPEYPIDFNLKPISDKIRRRINSVVFYYNIYSEPNSKVYKRKLIDTDFIRHILGENIEFPLTGVLLPDIQLLMRLPFNQLTHLIDVNQQVRDIINTDQFIRSWLYYNNYPDDVIKDKPDNMSYIDFFHRFNPSLESYYGGVLYVSNENPPYLKIDESIVDVLFKSKQYNRFKYIVDLFNMRNIKDMKDKGVSFRLYDLNRLRNKEERVGNGKQYLQYLEDYIINNLNIVDTGDGNFEILLLFMSLINRKDINKLMYFDEKFPGFIHNPQIIDAALHSGDPEIINYIQGN